MGREIAKKGKEYRDRCAFRKRPFHANDHVFEPAIFPAPEESRTVQSGCAPDLPPDDLEQIQSLLLKSVHFSQPLLDAIMKDRDAAFILQVSSTEQDIIEHPHSCYVLGRSGTGKTTTMLYKMVLVEANYERSKMDGLLDASVSKPRQLFVTQARILAEKVEEHYRRLSVGYQVVPTCDKPTVEQAAATDALVDADDDLAWRADLPDKFSELQDEHFPLFLTFDRLCTMVENDMEDKSAAKDISRLTYDRFLQHYWPHFPQNLTKGIDSAMVFSEFMGVIMGSEATLSGDSTALSQNAYLDLSERAQATFADQRERIYALFEAYLVRKRELRDVDAADRTHAIIRYLERIGVPGKKVDYLYVDESQDNLLIDTLVLRSICHNPNGLFWAGDTAQTISVGSSFRFDELKAFLYRIEEQRRKNKQIRHFSQPELQPRIFQLTVNYRSHAGIVNSAHTVIELIMRFWPYSIDVLDRERGTVDGLRPVFFTGFDNDTIQYEQFLFGDREGSQIEFGAQQCILVRDDAARDRLREQVGEIGLIMTLYESKGLEFNDVLLYNFFEDSPVTEGQWRVVLNAIEEGRRREAVPGFDAAKHAGVCVELKFLYVAITRARNNVWIADTSDKGKPMQAVWTSRDQVQVYTPGMDTPRLASTSTADEWEDQGRRLFSNKRYRQSKHCFERAHLPRLAAMAGAYYTRQEARKLPAGPGRRAIDLRKAAFRQAAFEFVACAREEGNVTYFRNAAQCCEEAGEDLSAAHLYRDAKEFTKSTEIFRKLGDFDEAVFNIKNHKSAIREDVLTAVTSVARLYYFKEQRPEKAQDLFDSFEEQLEYLEERGLDVARATLLERLGRYLEAGEVHLEEGRTYDAIGLFLRDRTNATAARRAIECILDGLWKRITFGVFPRLDDEVIATLLEYANQFDESLLTDAGRNELAMFRALCTRNTRALASLSEFFEEANPAAALICLDHYFARLPRMNVLPVEAIADILILFHRYVKVFDLYIWIDPCTHPTAGGLFGFERTDDNRIAIREGTFLDQVLRNGHPANKTAVRKGGEVILDSAALQELYGSSLRERLQERVDREDDACRRVKALAPCLTYAVFQGFCNRFDCAHEHLPASRINAAHYNNRIRIHLLQILILYTVQYLNIPLPKRRHWISRLYAALNPPYYKLGSAAALDLAQIPEAGAGLQVVRQWVRGWVYDCQFLPEEQFLTDFVQLTRLSFQFDRNGAMSYLTHAPYMSMQPMKYLRQKENYVVGEFLQAMEGKSSACICAAALFVRHVVLESLPINVSVLCDVIEHITACFVIADRAKRNQMHGLTLPLGWLVNWDAVYSEEERDTGPIFLLYFHALSLLIEKISTGRDNEHLLFRGQDLSKMGLQVHDTFLLRICRCLGFLGYNTRRMSTRMTILKTVTSAHRASTNPRKWTISHQFVTARRWQDIFRAVLSSTQASQQDEIVQLLLPHRKPPRVRANIRQIECPSVAAIPLMLNASSRAVIEGLGALKSDNEEEEEADATTDVPAENEDDDSDDSEDEEEADPIAEPAPLEMPPALEAVRIGTEEEVGAASTIQREWRAMRMRVEQRKASEMAQSAHTVGVAQFYTHCEAELRGCSADGGSAPAPAMEISTAYRVRFLGPLPHLLYCLTLAYAETQAHKTQAKKALRNATHEKLDAVDKELTDLTNALKQIIQLQKVLAPDAALHRDGNVDALKEQVADAATLLRNLPFSLPDAALGQLQRAYKGIVQPKAFVLPQPKPPKPELNVDDFLEYY